MDVEIRRATKADVDGILNIVNDYAAQNLMLPRTEEQVLSVLDWFMVADQGGQVVGCGSLVELTPQLTELRSLAVAAGFRGTGLGRRLVEALVAWGREIGYAQICALTLEVGFFNRLGFRTIDRLALSTKVWLECIYCPKFDACDEIAVLMDLKDPETVPELNEPDVYLAVWRRLQLARRTS